MPAGFLILVHKAGRGSDTVAQGVCDRIACADILARIVHNQRIYHITDPCGNILIGDIDPHAQLCSIFIFLFFTHIVKGGHHIAGLQRIAVVDIQRHRAVAAVDLAGLCGHGIDLSLGKHIVVLHIAEFKHAGIAVFKVKDHLGAHTELDGRGRGDLRANDRCGDAARGHAAVAGGEVKALDGANGIIFQRKCNVRRFDLDFIQAIRRRNGQRDRRVKGNGNLRAVKRQLFGNDCVDRNIADLAAVIHCTQNNIAFGRSGQNAVFVCAVGGGIGDVGGNLRRRSGRGYTRHGDLGGGARRYILVSGSHRNVIELVRRLRRRSDDKAGGDGTFGAVARGIDDSKGIFAFRLAAVGHRAAAVEVSGIYAAKVEHDLRLLHQGQACGCRLVIAVGRKKNDLAVGCNADRLAGVLLGAGLIVRRKRNFAAVNQHFIDADCFLNVALIRFVFAGIADLDRAVLHDCKIGRALSAGHVVAVHDKHAGGLAGRHVIVGRVDADDNRAGVIFVTGSGFFLKSCDLFGQFRHTIAGVVHVLIGREDLDRFDRGVDGRDKHFDLLPVLVIDRVEILRNAVCKSGLLVGNHRKLRLRKACCRKCGDRQQAENHDRAQKQRQESL